MVVNLQYALWYHDLCDVKKINPKVIEDALIWLAKTKPEVVEEWAKSVKKIAKKQKELRQKIEASFEPHSKNCSGVKHLEKVGYYATTNFYCTCGADDRNIKKMKEAGL
jgi:hypothetical protein